MGNNIDYWKDPFEAEPLEGYLLPKNEETGEVFPFCCEPHKAFYNDVKRHFAQFPDCCKGHKAIADRHQLNQDYVSDIALKIATLGNYTEYAIKNNINTPDWFENIRDYIQACAETLMHPPIGLTFYLHYVSEIVKQFEIVNELQKKQILEYIRSYSKRPDIENIVSDLRKTYSNWLEIFPFDISFFSKARTIFTENNLFLYQNPRTNKYSGFGVAEMHTIESLTKVLLDLTNSLLTQLNSYTLHNKGLLTKPQEIELELILNERKMNLKRGYVSNSQDENQQFRRILRKWFKDEKKFIREVAPFLKALPPQKKSQFSVLQWATIFYYADETKLLPAKRTVNSGIEQFVMQHGVITTISSFRNKYYEAKRRINEESNYPIHKLELIIPFLKEAYPQTVTKVENDISFLKEESTE